MPRYVAVSWTMHGGNGMSRIHVGDSRTAHTLCGIDRSGTWGPSSPDWFWMGEPRHLDYLGNLGTLAAAVSCPQCWSGLEYRRARGEAE